MRGERAKVRLVIGISGASGTIYGVRLLEEAEKAGVETHLVVSRHALLTLKLEDNFRLEELSARATRTYRSQDVSAAIASGSFRTDGMVVCPCSIRTASAIAYSMSDNLLVRSADVTLKEGRKLVLVVREAPLHVGHLRTLTRLAEMGAVIFPPVPAFYTRPTDIDELILQTVGRLLDQFGIESPTLRRWEGPT